MNTKEEIAIMEGEMIHAQTEYFNARPELASKVSIEVFNAGFDRAWKAKLKREERFDNPK